MSPTPSTPIPAWLHRLSVCTVLTALFMLLNYMGSSLYHLAGGLTTVKPFSGVALALILIMGERWLWPILAAGTVGGIIAKLAVSAAPRDMLMTPLVTSLTLLAVYLVARRMIGKRIDFRAWRQLAAFIAITTLLSAVSSTGFNLALKNIASPHFWSDWQAWFIPTALSYVIFTPVMVLLATADRRSFAANWKKLSGCLVLMAAVLALNFAPTRQSLLFAIPMALLIVTLISGLEGVALGLVLTEFVLTTATVTGFTASGVGYLSLGSQLYFIQIFMAILIAVMLPVAAAVAERVRLRGGMEQALEREAQVNTALRASERNARDLAAEAQAANKAKSDFLASMSHELRTPLNAILGFSEILKSELYGPLGHPKYVEYSEDVFKSGAHLLDLINDVLDLSKIDAGRMDLRESIFPLRGLASDCVHLMADRARGHVTLQLQVDGPLDVLADQRLIKQVLLNLLSNAIKFTPKGGTITIGGGETAGGIELYVADSGIGMTQAQIEKAFSHYGQIDSKIARTHQGTGLGLPISQALARLHGGDLLATSTPGEGTRMMLLLPESRIVRDEPLAARSVG